MAESGPKSILAMLNSMSSGTIGQLQRELQRAQTALSALGQPELEARLGEAGASLLKGDLKEFRRAVANVTAKVGHLK